ncbi:MAG: hypothetical protein WA144_11720 [Candidatus Methanoperedens sp.]
MTAEIAIMNKHAIALASDSAVTMSQGAGEKIKTSANKLFALSKYHPVGIMIYGNANIMEVPWETIIKIYRAKLGRKKFGTLKEYSDNFIAFLDNGNPLFPDSQQENYVLTSIYAYFYFIKDEIEKEVESAISKKNEITQDDVKQITSTIIKKHYENWKNADLIPSIPSSHIEDIINKYNKNIEDAIYEVFEKLPLYKSNLGRLKELAGTLFSKSYIIPDDFSGVVIAGFGEIDIFPSLRRYSIEGVANNILKYTEIPPVEIGFGTHASIIPFAQREMVDTFMVGVDPSYTELEESYIAEIFSKYTEIITNNMNKYNNKEKLKLKKKLQIMSNEILKDHQEKLRIFRKETYTDPVTSVVSMLPKDELAAMAEALVNLTSFKRKVSMETETVGGPIDVAVISKGDGFIWIKRKHYFKPELNPGFFTNYYKEEIEDGEK